MRGIFGVSQHCKNIHTHVWCTKHAHKLTRINETCDCMSSIIIYSIDEYWWNDYLMKDNLSSVAWLRLDYMLLGNQRSMILRVQTLHNSFKILTDMKWQQEGQWNSPLFSLFIAELNSSVKYIELRKKTSKSLDRMRREALGCLWSTP